MYDERRIDRMAGCSCLGQCMLIAGAVVLGMYLLMNLHHSTCPPASDGHRLSVQGVIREFKTAILDYEDEHHRLPIQGNDGTAQDLETRSRGMLLQVLQGENISMLNPQKVRYAEFPLARERKNGIWQDGEEWVLSDYWGEPFYIIFDTSKDEQVPNPEFGVISSDPKQAEFNQKYPPPKILPMTMAIYSSGPDQNPKTWDDNVCSWRPR